MRKAETEKTERRRQRKGIGREKVRILAHEDQANGSNPEQTRCESRLEFGLKEEHEQEIATERQTNRQTDGLTVRIEGQTD